MDSEEVRTRVKTILANQHTESKNEESW
jgi:hypothetical protein